MSEFEEETTKSEVEKDKESESEVDEEEEESDEWSGSEVVETYVTIDSVFIVVV